MLEIRRRYYLIFSDLEVYCVEVPRPLQSVQSLLDAYENMFHAHSNIKVVIIGMCRLWAMKAL